LNEFFLLFLNNLLPIFLAAGAGFLLVKALKISPLPLSRVTFYIFSPCLIFSLLTHNNLDSGDIARSILFAGVLMAVVGFLAWITTKSLKFERTTISAILLTTIFMNAGNFGLPLALFAFGKVALGYASIYFITMAIFLYSAGIVIASLGSVSLVESLKNLVKIPVIYALLLAMLIVFSGWKVPLFLDRTITLLGDASIPTMLVLLGMQLTNVRLNGLGAPLALAIIMRLLVSPAIALLLVSIFGMTAPASQVSVTFAAMPSAVFNTVLATEYNVKPSFVTAVVFITTILSPLSLTPLLAFLGA
jgi:predicted permease